MQRENVDWTKILLSWILYISSFSVLFSQVDEVVGNVRVQPLSPSLVRIELKGPNGFENRETFHIAERNWPGNIITRTASDSSVLINTPDYIVRVPENASSLDGIKITSVDGAELWGMSSSSYTTIKCRWLGNGEAYLYDNGDRAAYGTIPNTDYYYWMIESRGGYIQIKNKATGDYLNIENLKEYVECTPVQTYWHSKDWVLEEIGGSKRLRCRWAEHQDYIHMENLKGYAQHGGVQPSWWSAMWSISGTNICCTIKCKWSANGDAYLYDSGDKASYGSNPSSEFYYWMLEFTDGYIQIRNKATGDYLNVENLRDYVECTPVQPYWHSKDWVLEDVDGASRLRCRWRDHQDYIHTENFKDYAQRGSVQPSWLSARWVISSSDNLTNNSYWLPNPKDTPQAWAIVDTPRYVPADWGYSPAPANSSYYDTNGWDLTNNAPDVYVFLPKGDRKQLRSDFITLTGRSELIPLYALGGWDSRYHPYTDQEALAKIDTYRSKNIPLDVFVIDTDWRVGASIGYDVNTKLFPDMTNFLFRGHEKNVKFVFNDHPEPQAEGLNPIEVHYRNNGLRSLFDMGLDFWWFDRNWWTTLLPPAGINKEVFGMYLYNWVVKDYYPNRRPLIMANMDGIDNGWIARPANLAAHRYTMQWTGDTQCDFASLEREVKNAVFSGVHVPYAYTSADLGGHIGTPTVEQYCRWVQYGALSPIFRLHCTNNVTRDPWAYAAPAEDVVRKFVQMRMRLLPVLYTAARMNYDNGEPILRRCDLEYPDYSDAARNDQYLLGNGILVAPIIRSGNARTLWLPPGTWINAWDGTRVEGPREITASATLEQMPIYVKTGTIVPLAPDMQYSSQKNWDSILLDVYPDTSNAASALLYEDDRVSNGYKAGDYRKTEFVSITDNFNKQVTVKIKPAQGYYSEGLGSRAWKIRMRTPSNWNSSCELTRITVDGIEAEFRVFNKTPGVMPFVFQGGAADSNVIELDLSPLSVYVERNVIFSYVDGCR